MEIKISSILIIVFAILAIKVAILKIPIHKPSALDVFLPITTLLIILILGFSLFVFAFAKPSVDEKEEIYNVIEQSNDTGIIVYEADGDVITKDVSGMWKAYDNNSVNSYVAALRCYIGPFYVIKDCYVCGNKEVEEDKYTKEKATFVPQKGSLIMRGVL